MQDINVLAKTRIKSFARVSTLSELALKHCCNNDCNPLNAKCNPMTINVVQMTKKNWGSVRIFSCSNKFSIFSICGKYFESAGLTPGAGLPPGRIFTCCHLSIYPRVRRLKTWCWWRHPRVPRVGIHVTRVRIHWVLFHPESWDLWRVLRCYDWK